MIPPWKKFPSYSPSSKLWKEDDGLAYMRLWRDYFDELEDSEKVQYKKDNSPPFYWFFFYWQKNLPESWTFPFILLLILSWPFRFIHHSIFKKTAI